MKTLSHLLLMCSLGFLVSCDKTTNGAMPDIKKNNVEEGASLENRQMNPKESDQSHNEVPDGYDEGREYPHFFTEIIVPNTIDVTPSWSGADLPEKYLLWVRFGGDRFAQMYDKQNKQFSALATQIGDLPQKPGEGYMHYRVVTRATLNTGVKNLTLKALTKYNDKYPAGSDLMSILRVHYRSFEHIFSAPNRPRKGYGKLHSQLCSNGFQPINYLDAGGVVHRYPGGGAPSVPMHGVGLYLELLEEPSYAQPQLELIAELEDGKVLRCVIDKLSPEDGD